MPKAIFLHLFTWCAQAVGNNKQNLLMCSVLWQRTISPTKTKAKNLGSKTKDKKKDLEPNKNKFKAKDAGVCPQGIPKTKTSPQGCINNIMRMQQSIRHCRPCWNVLISWPWSTASSSWEWVPEDARWIIFSYLSHWPLISCIVQRWRNCFY